MRLPTRLVISALFSFHLTRYHPIRQPEKPVSSPTPRPPRLPDSLTPRLLDSPTPRSLTPSLLAFFLPRIQLLDHLPMVLQYPASPDLHGRGDLAMLDREIALQDAKAADLLERRELLVRLCHRLLHLRDHHGRSRNLLRRTALEFLHPLEAFHVRGVQREERRHVRQAVSDQQHLVDQRLGLKKALDARGIDLLSVGRDDQIFLAARDEGVPFGVDLGNVAGREPAAAEHCSGRTAIFVIAREHRRTLDHHLAIVGESHLHAGKRFADAARLRAIQRIQRDDAALGETIALDQRHSDGRKEFRQLLAKRRRARYRDAYPATEPAPDLRETKPVCQLEHSPHPQRDTLARLFQLAGFGAKADRAVKHFAGERARLSNLRGDAREYALPHARRGQQERQPDTLPLVRQFGQAL